MEAPFALRQLRYFVAVAEELHFGRAAERLHMSQSPLSRAIREFERELGVVLFVRTTRDVELTSAGIALLERARPALAEIEAAVADARGAAKSESGLVSVGYTPMTRLQATQIAAALMAEHPELRLRLDEDVTPELLRRVAAHDLTAAVVLETPAAARLDRVRVDTLRDEPLLAALPATHDYAGADALPIRVFVSECVLLPRKPAGGAFNAWLRSVIRAAGFELDRTLETLSAPWDRRMLPVAAGDAVSEEGDVEELRAEAEELKGLGIAEIVDHYADQIAALDRPPVLIGHSFGGLITELLLDRGLGRAGVAISPAPPKGILVLPFSSLKAAAPALAHPSKWHGVVPLTLEEFTFGFVNTFSPEDAAAAYERYAVPETGQIFYEAGFANFHLHPPTEVHFKNDDRPPLLIVGGEKDNTVPASVSKKQYEKYEKSDARTDYIEFTGRPHLMMIGKGLGGGRRGDRQLARRRSRGACARSAGGLGGSRADGRLIAKPPSGTRPIAS